MTGSETKFAMKVSVGEQDADEKEKESSTATILDIRQ